MLAVGLSAGELKAEKSDHGRTRVRKVIDRVGYDGDRSAYDTCEKLRAEEQKVQNDTGYSADYAPDAAIFGGSRIIRGFAGFPTEQFIYYLRHEKSPL